MSSYNENLLLAIDQWAEEQFIFAGINDSEMKSVSSDSGFHYTREKANGGQGAMISLQVIYPATVKVLQAQFPASGLFKEEITSGMREWFVSLAIE